MRAATIIPLLAGLAVATPHFSFAANARAPYSNVDPRNDAGNDTGDSQVERLNQAQLNHGPALHYPAPRYRRPPAAYYDAPAYPGRYGYGY